MHTGTDSWAVEDQRHMRVVAIRQGMGGTGTALVQDGATLFFNPGGAAFLKENSVSLGTSPVIAHSKFADSASSVVSETTSPVSFPFIL